MKRILALVLAALMMLCVFASCNVKMKTGKSDTPAYTRDGEKIIFGSYPQSEVTDKDIKAKLDSKAGELPTKENPQGWALIAFNETENSSKYVWRIDAEYDGERYQGVYGVKVNIVLPKQPMGDDPVEPIEETDIFLYWFKYEPIVWTIVDENKDDGTAVLFSDMILDAREFSKDNYSQGGIRSFLNETFYNVAFDKNQKDIILTTQLDNSAEGMGGETTYKTCDNTKDKVFLFSSADFKKYGLSGGINDFTLQRKATYYAQRFGACDNEWWLRSGDIYTLKGCFEFDASTAEEALRMYYEMLDTMVSGIIPALKIKLK